MSVGRELHDLRNELTKLRLQLHVRDRHVRLLLGAARTAQLSLAELVKAMEVVLSEKE